MDTVFKLTFLFMAGTVAGWIIELFWRRFFGLAKRWINPGFLNGPWLPIYGFGTIVLYYISNLSNNICKLIPVYLIALTLIELLTGLLFVKFYKIRLWDYRTNRFNVMGIICPFYSFLWTALGVLFYLFIAPVLSKHLHKILTHYELSFFLGIYLGVFLVDLIISFNLANRIKTVVINSGQKWHVEYETFKIELRDRFEKNVKNKTHFLLPFNGESGVLLKSRLHEHSEKLKRIITNRDNSC